MTKTALEIMSEVPLASGEAPEKPPEKKHPPPSPSP